jgi:hypothetical protein
VSAFLLLVLAPLLLLAILLPREMSRRLSQQYPGGVAAAFDGIRATLADEVE